MFDGLKIANTDYGRDEKLVDKKMKIEWASNLIHKLPQVKLLTRMDEIVLGPELSESNSYACCLLLAAASDIFGDNQQCSAVK